MEPSSTIAWSAGFSVNLPTAEEALEIFQGPNTTYDSPKPNLDLELDKGTPVNHPVYYIR